MKEDFRGVQVERDVASAMISDETLMLEFKYGSRAGFEVLDSRYRGPLYGFFRRRLNGDKTAEDLTQETFLAVIKAVDHYEPRSLVRTYLYGIAMNLLHAERRRGAREVGDDYPEPSTQEDSDKVLWVRQALGRLDSSEREILMLREYEQLSYFEIAELLNLPVNTVRSRLFRARIAIKEQLESGGRADQESVAGAIHENAMLKSAEGKAL